MSAEPSLFDADDLVRREVASALTHNAYVVPILVGDASMPREDELPPDVAALARRQALKLDDESWVAGVERLVAICERQRPPSAPAQASIDEAPVRARIVQMARDARAIARALVAGARALIAFHPVFSHLLASIGVGLVALVALTVILPRAPVPAPPATAFAVFSADGKRFATAAANGGVALGDPTIPKLEPVSVPGRRATAAAFNADGSRLLVGFDDGSIRALDAVTRSILSALDSSHRDAILAMSFGPNGQLLTASADGVFVWDAEQKQSVIGMRPPVQASTITAITFSHAGDRVAMLQADGELRIFNVRGTAQAAASLDIRCESAAPPAFAPDDRIVACGARDGALILRNVAGDNVSGETATRTPSPKAVTAAGDTTSIAFSPDGRLVAAGRRDGFVDLWDLNARKLLEPPLSGLQGRVLAAAFSPSGNLFAAADPSQLEFWPLQQQSATTGTAGAGGSSPLTAPPQRSAMPVITGLTVARANAVLEPQKLRLDTPETRASSSPRGTIVEQTPPAGNPVIPGATVKVVVSDGSRVRVPIVIGMSADVAQKMLAQAGLALSRMQEVESSQRAGTVIAQQPQPNVELARGSSVTLTVAKGSAAQVPQAPPGPRIDPAPETPAPAQAPQATTGPRVDPGPPANAPVVAPRTESPPNAAPVAPKTEAPTTPAPNVQARGWCCTQRGSSVQQGSSTSNPRAPAAGPVNRPFQSTADECRKQGGVFATEEGEATKLCAGSPRPPATSR